jgi:hypothetical protein
MKKVIVFLCLLFPTFLFPCTTLSFLDQSNDRIFGKSFDWYFNHGFLFVNKRNVEKEALVLDNSTPLKWVSKFGSVTFNQHGRDFPLGGMNEAGMVMEIMIGPAEDVADSELVKSVNEVQIIQYVLDSFSNVADMSRGLENVRVARVVSKVHYLVCDKKSDCASVEYLDGKLNIHKGADLPYNAFTNSSYDESAASAAHYEGLGGTEAIPTDGASISRFVRAASRAKTFHGGNSTAYAHSFLDQVALSGRWRIVYHGQSEISFRVDPNLNSLKTISMNLDYKCSSPVKMFDLTSAGEGDIGSKLETYSKERNATLVNTNYLLPADVRKKMIDFPETTKCLDREPQLAAAN